MNGLKLIAAGICGSALTVAVTTFAQAPRRVTECPVPAELYVIESKISSLSDKTDLIFSEVNRMQIDLTNMWVEGRR